ncbi:MAG: hypothetical protein AAGI14_04175 [Pseudomonadota bacterium]
MVFLSRFLLLAIFTIAGSFPLQAEPSDLTPQTGTALYWVGHDGSSSYRFQEMILYHEDDLTLYQTFPDEFEADREPMVDDFYVLLSGVQYAACNEDLPDIEYREQLKAFVRNGSEGDEFEIVSEDPTTLKINPEQSFFFMGETYQGLLIDSSSNDEQYLIDRATGLNFKLRWAEEMSDTLVLKTAQKEIDFSEIMVHLGNCATLISE